MAQIAILERKCTGCGLCVENCPFGAIDMKEGHPELNAACKVYLREKLPGKGHSQVGNQGGERG